MQTVETFTASEFICEECGRNSFFEWVPITDTNVTEEDIAEIRELMGVDADFPANEIYTEPDTVTCAHCQACFEVCNNANPDKACKHKIKTTETFQAGGFSCPKCRTCTLFSLTTLDVANVDDDALKELKDEAGADVHEPGEVVIMPTVLQCHQCKKKFKPANPSQE